MKTFRSKKKTHKQNKNLIKIPTLERLNKEEEDWTNLLRWSWSNKAQIEEQWQSWLPWTTETPFLLLDCPQMSVFNFWVAQSPTTETSKKEMREEYCEKKLRK